MDHTTYEFSSVVKLIERLQGLGSMTACDARADDMREAFDFETKGAPAEPELLLKQRPCPPFP